MWTFFFQTPRTQEEWRAEATGFLNRWQYPLCIGALDGKHVEIVKPNKSGSLFYNYKLFFSIVLMVLANSNYEILYADIGSEGRLSDGGIWKKSDFFNKLEKEELGLPEDGMLQDTAVAHHIVADDAFALSKRLMKPYSKRGLTEGEEIFNYRLSRARRIVENVFGILGNRFRVLQSSISGACVDTNQVVLACCVLHNLLRRECPRGYLSHQDVDTEDVNGDLQGGEWRKRVQLAPIAVNRSTNYPQDAKAQRDIIQSYFLSPAGEVTWQYDRQRRLVAREIRRDKDKK